MLWMIGNKCNKTDHEAYIDLISVSHSFHGARVTNNSLHKNRKVLTEAESITGYLFLKSITKNTRYLYSNHNRQSVFFQFCLKNSESYHKY